MLVLSPSASTAIRGLVDRPELPDVTGVRIAGEVGGPEELRISTADMPEEGDQVVEQDGARVFLAPRVADALDDKILDASVDDRGRIGFLISSQ